MIYKNLLERTATAYCSECKAKHEEKLSYNVNDVVSGFTDIFANDWKDIRAQIEGENIYISEKYCII